MEFLQADAPVFRHRVCQQAVTEDSHLGFGLFVAQAAMLLLVRRFSDPVVRLIGDQGLRLAAGIWIGIGCAFSWSMMVA